MINASSIGLYLIETTVNCLIVECVLLISLMVVVISGYSILVIQIETYSLLKLLKFLHT